MQWFVRPSQRTASVLLSKRSPQQKQNWRTSFNARQFPCRSRTSCYLALSVLFLICTLFSINNKCKNAVLQAVSFGDLSLKIKKPSVSQNLVNPAKKTENQLKIYTHLGRNASIVCSPINQSYLPQGS